MHEDCEVLSQVVGTCACCRTRQVQHESACSMPDSRFQFCCLIRSRKQSSSALLRDDIKEPRSSLTVLLYRYVDVRLPPAGLLVAAFCNAPQHRTLIMDELVGGVLPNAVPGRIAARAAAALPESSPPLHIVPSLVLQLLQVHTVATPNVPSFDAQLTTFNVQQGSAQCTTSSASRAEASVNAVSCEISCIRSCCVLMFQNSGSNVQVSYRTPGHSFRTGDCDAARHGRRAGGNAHLLLARDRLGGALLEFAAGQVANRICSQSPACPHFGPAFAVHWPMHDAANRPRQC